MSKTYRHQDRYNYLHENKEVPKNRLYKLYISIIILSIK